MSLKFLIIASVMVGASLANKKPSYPPPPKSNYPASSKYEDVPHCAKNTTKTVCLSDYEYPLYEIQQALNQHYQAVLSLYKDVESNTDNSVDGLKNLKEETYLCPSSTDYIQPLRAVNVDGKWRVVVNKVESYNYVFTQTARTEECDVAVGAPCPLVPSCYESSCVQKNMIHRFLVFDPYDHDFPFAIESFKLPASCACVVGAFYH